MAAVEHNKILAIGFAVFSTIFGFTFLLLLVVSLGVFFALGVTLGNETGNTQEAGIGIVGGIVTVIFYGFLGAVFVVPTALASRKMLKRRRDARIWGIIASILVAPIIPLGTMLGIYGLWFFFSTEGRRFYLSAQSQAVLNL